MSEWPQKVSEWLLLMLNRILTSFTNDDAVECDYPPPFLFPSPTIFHTFSFPHQGGRL